AQVCVKRLMLSSFSGKRQSKRELWFADSRRGQQASQLRTSPLAGWSILWTRAWTIFPPPVLYGGPTTFHSPVSSTNPSPTRSCIGRTVLVVGGAGSGASSPPDSSSSLKGQGLRPGRALSP